MIEVFCQKCWDYIPESKIVIVLDICEDEIGADVLTYICPDCNTEQSSHRFSRGLK